VSFNLQRAGRCGLTLAYRVCLRPTGTATMVLAYDVSKASLIFGNERRCGVGGSVLTMSPETPSATNWSRRQGSIFLSTTACKWVRQLAGSSRMLTPHLVIGHVRFGCGVPVGQLVQVWHERHHVFPGRCQTEPHQGEELVCNLAQLVKVLWNKRHLRDGRCHQCKEQLGVPQAPGHRGTWQLRQTRNRLCRIRPEAVCAHTNACRFERRVKIFAAPPARRCFTASGCTWKRRQNNTQPP